MQSEVIKQILSKKKPVLSANVSSEQVWDLKNVNKRYVAEAYYRGLKCGVQDDKKTSEEILLHCQISSQIISKMTQHSQKKRYYLPIVSSAIFYTLLLMILGPRQVLGIRWL